MSNFSRIDRLNHDRQTLVGKVRWRVTPVRHRGKVRYALYRNGVRMWRFRTIPEAMEYIKRNVS
jgi:hypothetical protein